MIIELAGAADNVTDFDCELAPDLNDDTIRLAGPVRAVGRINSAAGRAEVSGKITGTIECDCSRCLAQVALPVDFAFRDRFITEERFSEEAEAEVALSDLDVALFDGESIDLGEIVREQLLLFVPEQIFCAADCRGLCPECGENRNRTDCGCGDNETDPRWAALKNLKLG